MTQEKIKESLSLFVIRDLGATKWHTFAGEWETCRFLWSGHEVSPITTGKPMLRDPLENCLLCKTNSGLTANSLSEHSTCKYINLPPYSSRFWLFYLMTSSFKIIESVLHWPLEIMAINQQHLSEFQPFLKIFPPYSIFRASLSSAELPSPDLPSPPYMPHSGSRAGDYIVAKPKLKIIFPPISYSN